MNILYLISGMFNPAGMERVVANKANYFASQGHSVTIVTTDQKSRKSFYKLLPEIKLVDLSVNFEEYKDYPLMKRIFSFYYKNRLLKKRLTQLLIEHEFDITISLILKSADFLYQIKDHSKKIIEHHFSRYFYFQITKSYYNNPVNTLIYTIRDKILIHNLKKYAAFVVLTQEDALDWKKELSNVFVIPNSIEIPQRIAPLKSKNIIAIGRLNYQKGFDYLLRIWEKVSVKFPDWSLCIYGCGDMYNNLLSEINTKKIQNITIRHPVNEIDKPILNSSIYVLTSRFEGLPMTLLETMSYGVPPIAFACKCGPKDIIINGKNGFLITPYDLVSFESHLIKLIEDESLRIKMGRQAKISMESYTHSIIMDQWLQLFNDLLLQER